MKGMEVVMGLYNLERVPDQVVKGGSEVEDINHNPYLVSVKAARDVQGIQGVACARQGNRVLPNVNVWKKGHSTGRHEVVGSSI